MRTFEYSRWSGAKRTVEAESVEFTAHHVVFKKSAVGNPYNEFIILAEKVENCHELREVTE